MTTCKTVIKSSICCRLTCMSIGNIASVTLDSCSILPPLPSTARAGLLSARDFIHFACQMASAGYHTSCCEEIIILLWTWALLCLRHKFIVETDYETRTQIYLPKRCSPPRAISLCDFQEVNLIPTPLYRTSWKSQAVCLVEVNTKITTRRRSASSCPDSDVWNRQVVRSERVAVRHSVSNLTRFPF